MTNTTTVVTGMSAAEILAAYRIAKAAENTVADAQRGAYAAELKAGLDLIDEHTPVQPSPTSKFVGWRADRLPYTNADGVVGTITVIFTDTASTKERGELLAALKEANPKATRDDVKAFLAACDTEAGVESSEEGDTPEE